MTRRLAGAVAAGAFTLGTLTVVAAGPVLGQGPTTPADDATTGMVEHMAAMDEHMAAMVEHMNGRAAGAMMDGMMSGAGSPQMPMRPDASAMPMDPDDHSVHHAPRSPEATR